MNCVFRIANVKMNERFLCVVFVSAVASVLQRL